MEIESDPKKRGMGKTALVVDDHAVIRRKLAAAFLSDGLKTCGEAENGKESIRVTRQIKPDLILLDLSMPVMNGLDVASELRKTLPNTPITLFTMYADSLSKTDASKAGVSRVLPKTVPFPTLNDNAHELMGN